MTTSSPWRDKNYATAWKRDWLNRHPELREKRKRIMRQQRKEFIESLELAMGGACQRCGYDSCFAALDFHHVNSQQKDALVSSLATGHKWIEAEQEADKCVLLCGNCHREYEHGFWTGDFVKRDGLLTTPAKITDPRRVTPELAALAGCERWLVEFDTPDTH